MFNVLVMIDCFQTAHHVHFNAVNLSDFESESCVTYHSLNHDSIVVNLGFLQIGHKYTVDLKLPWVLFRENGASPHQYIPSATNPQFKCCIKEFSAFKHDEHDIYKMKIEFLAYEENFLREVLYLNNRIESNDFLKVVLTAKVLGRGKGTPMLRNGISCIGIETDVESDT